MVVADPPFPPLHKTLLVIATVAVSNAGCVIVATAVTEQVFASVTVQVYVPEKSPDAVAAVPPLGDHE